MLRMMMFDSKTGDEAFKVMMRDFVQSHFNKNATTESFKAIVDKHMTPLMDIQGNHRSDWFFYQWVFSTDVPRYKFDHTITPGAAGKFTLKASLVQSEVGPNFVSLVPIYADFDGRVIMIARIRIMGNSTVPEITLDLPQKPKRVLINARYDVLSRK
jgi:hypothetical protein